MVVSGGGPVSYARGTPVRRWGFAPGSTLCTDWYGMERESGLLKAVHLSHHDWPGESVNGRFLSGSDWYGVLHQTVPVRISHYSSVSGTVWHWLK